MTPPFHELAGSPVETYGPEGLTARRTLACAWADRAALVRALLGDGYTFGPGRATYPTAPAAVAMRVRVEPLMHDPTGQPLGGLSQGLSEYRGFARVTVDYELLAHAASGLDVPAAEPNTLLSYHTEPAEEHLHWPGEGLAWLGNPELALPADVRGSVRLPAVRHWLTWRRVTRPPWSSIRQCRGALNHNDFLGAAAGTLLFEGAAAGREFLRLSDLHDAEHVWRLEYSFRENPLLPTAEHGAGRTADFTTLLRFAPHG